MTAWFASPWGLFALLALPAVYFLHRYVIETRRREVSNLALWSDREQLRHEGRVRRRVSDWWVLLLELGVALALALVIAGFEPASGRTTHRRIALVIDTSASMSAGAPGRRPIDQVRAQLEAAAATPGVRVSLVLAADQPRLLGDADLTPERALALLAALQPEAASSRIEPAIELARALDLAPESLLVISDDPSIMHQRLWRPGDREPNLAIVRASWERDEAPFVVVRRFGPGPAAVDVRVQLDDGPIETQHIALDASGEAPLALRVAPTVKRVDIRLPGDVMPLDDQAVLLRPPVREVRVDSSGVSASLQMAVRQAIAAIPLLHAAATGVADLRITEAVPAPTDTPSLLFAAQRHSKAQPVFGLDVDPFSPLTAAIEVRGLNWYAWPMQPPPAARVLLRANEQALIWQEGTAITCNVDLERSNLLSHAAFPVFLDALAQEIDRARGGLPRTNFALGEVLRIAPDARWTTDVSIRTPRGETRTFAAHAEIDLGVLREPGIYELRVDKEVQHFSVHLSSAAESNLEARRPSGGPPPLAGQSTTSTERRSFWITLLTVLALACACLAFTRLERQGSST
jgi:hypothetical protein